MSENERTKEFEKQLESATKLLESYEKQRESDAKVISDMRKEIRWKNFLIILLIIIIILLLLFRCSREGSDDFCETSSVNVTEEKIPEPSSSEEVAETTPPPTVSTQEKQYVTMPVLSSFSVSKGNPTVTVYNPVENEGLFNICYVFVDGEGNEIYNSGMRKAGETWEIDFYELLEKGTHNVRASIKSEYVETGKKASGTGSDITITVK